MTPAEIDRALHALIKWRLVFKHGTTMEAKLDAARAIALIEAKLYPATPPGREGG